MNAWIVILAVGAGTFALRLSMFVVLSGRSLPAWTDRPMALVAPAAMAAMVAGMAFTAAGRPAMPALAPLAAIVVGFWAVRRSGDVKHVFVAGLPVVWLLTALTGG